MTPPESTFRVRIKLDSYESKRRLRSLERKIGFPRGYLIGLIRMVDLEGKLQNELQLAEHQISITVELLELAQVDEREYMATGVLAVEAGFKKLRGLLRQLDGYVEKELSVPSGCYLLAATLANELNSERMGLYRLRKSFENEVVPQPKTRPTRRGAMLEMTVLQATSCGSKIRAVVPAHYETERVYSNGGCSCREYV